MLSKSLKFSAVSLVLAIAPAFAQISTIPATSPGGEILAPRQHAPRKVYTGFPPQVMGNVTVEESTNWSGYAVTGSSFTKALGSWTVPTVNCSSTPNTYAAFWVGIDGWTSDSVEQTGTDSDCDGKTPSYYAWYEFFPNPSFLISSIAVAPGDQMKASVTYSSSTKKFTIAIENITTGKTYSKSATVSGAKRSSAEWIAEAPCCTNSGGILPLADFDTVELGKDFTDVGGTNHATDSAKSGVISSFGSSAYESIMVNGTTGADEAVPSGLSSDGTSFEVKWDSE